MVSPRKSKSSLSLASEDRFKMNSSIKSCESIYSNATSKASPGVLYRRNRVQNPGVCQQPSMIPASTEVRQRVLSARRLKIKNYQNQLADAKQTIEDLMHENRMLQTLHKRQDNALAKYESSNAELPQLLNAHSEELRMWQTKFKNLQITNKDLEQKLKQKEALIMSLSDQNKYFSQLNKDKNLLDRQELREENDALKAQLKEKENELKLLIKKFQLEAKNFKQQMQNEQKKTKNALIELENFKMEVSAFNKIDQITTKVAAARPKTSKPSVKFDKTSENCSKPLLDLDSKAQPKMEKYLSEDSNLKKNKQKLLKEKCSNVISTKGNHTKEYDNNVAETENDFESLNDGYLNSDRCPSDNSFPDEAEMKLAEEEFKAIRLRTDISNIRNKILGDDYNKREQFIDGFCLKNNSQMNEEDILDDEDKYRKLSKA